MSKHQTEYGWPAFMPYPVATKYACCSRWTIQRAVAEGKLRVAGKRGRSPLFKREDLDRWMLGTGEPTEATSTVSVRGPATTNASAQTEIRDIAKAGSVNGNG